MKKLKSLFIIFAAFAIALSGCKDESSVAGFESESMTDMEALHKLVEEDETLQSFDLNYNEDGTESELLGKIESEIFPVHVGQRMRLINRDLNITIDGNTAYGVLTKTFDGVLFIAASLDEFEPGEFDVVDTMIEKSFTTVITRNLVFEKRTNDFHYGDGKNGGNEDGKKGNGNNGNGYNSGGQNQMGGSAYDGLHRYNDWRITESSLPSGGTLTENINIVNMTIFLPNGDQLSINDPGSYFIIREPGVEGRGNHREMPALSRFETVTIRLQVESKYEKPDYLTLSHGATLINPAAREKRFFEFVSSEFNGEYYTKVYEGTWTTRNGSGYKHAVVTALPQQVVHDEATEVETVSWGIPYQVK